MEISKINIIEDTGSVVLAQAVLTGPTGGTKKVIMAFVLEEDGYQFPDCQDAVGYGFSKKMGCSEDGLWKFKFFAAKGLPEGQSKVRKDRLNF